MLRGTFLYFSNQSWLRGWVENSPISGKLTSRFIAGKTLAEGLSVLQRLASENTAGTLDFLGENVHSLTEATQSKNRYLEALDQIERAGLRSTVSVKLTQLGLNYSEEACRQNLVELVSRAKEIGSRVESDMESSEYTDRTLDAVIDLHNRFEGCVRAVIQAYLYRSENDVRRLSVLGIPIRLCKGAYRESSRVAFPKKADVDANYVTLMKELLRHGTFPAIASQPACRCSCQA